MSDPGNCGGQGRKYGVIIMMSTRMHFSKSCGRDLHSHEFPSRSPKVM